MKSKIISLVLVIASAFSSALVFTGCAGGEYPVEVANITVRNQPESIVVLDPATADILIATGYDKLLVGRSDEVDQTEISVAPSMGSQETPDADKIINSGASIVFAGESIDDSVRKKLEDSGIQVISMSAAQTPKQVETNYVTICKICGGMVTGAQKGEDSYNDLLDKLDTYKQQVSERNSGILDTVCYLYTEDDQLKMMTSGSYGDMLLGYTGAVNAAVNITDNTVDVSTLKVANPSFLFYADEETLAKIQGDATLSKLNAMKNKKNLMVSLDEMNRPGNTALATVEKMVYFMYPDLKPASDSTPDTAQQTTSAAQASTQSAEQNATQVTTQAATEASKSLASKYGITITSKLSLKEENENDNVKALQQRLYDLGYVTDEENITGYYGEITADAVKTFQKTNGLKETGTADNATLVLIFDSSAKKAE